MAKAEAKKAKTKTPLTKGKSKVPIKSKIAIKANVVAKPRGHVAEKPKKEIPPKEKAHKVGAKQTAKAEKVVHPSKPVAPSHATAPKDTGKPDNICSIESCDEVRTTGEYCRYHYISKWKRIKKKERVLAEKRLNKYIEELTARYPEEYLEVIRRDLATEKSFADLLGDLEIEDFEVPEFSEEDDEGSRKGGMGEGEEDF